MPCEVRHRVRPSEPPKAQLETGTPVAIWPRRPALRGEQQHAIGRAGKDMPVVRLPIDADQLQDCPSGQLFGLTQNAGMAGASPRWSAIHT